MTLIVKPRNRKEKITLEHFLKAWNLEYIEDKENNIITDPELIRRIELAKKDRKNNSIRVDPNDIWKSIL